jgi:hypothetical protein
VVDLFHAEGGEQSVGVEVARRAQHIGVVDLAEPLLGAGEIEQGHRIARLGAVGFLETARSEIEPSGDESLGAILQKVRLGEPCPTGAIHFGWVSHLR